ncbi:MAG: DUF1570 domain-containing protein [Isosphaeraceae bacterium]
MCRFDSLPILDGALLPRRDWLQWAARGLAGAGLGLVLGNIKAKAQQPKTAAAGLKAEDDRAVAEPELAELQKRLVKAGIGPLVTVRSAHYVAIGDAPEASIKLILGDCEQLASDYLKHFQSRGFAVRLPERRMVVAMFRDDRSFGRFFHLPTWVELADKKEAIQSAGRYYLTTNTLFVFDWRNVPIMPRSAHKNMQTLSHEGTHQLSFNTGLLNRAGDTPHAIVEGLGTYGEARKIMGPSDLGRPNVTRMEDLAKIQRRVAWIPVRELLTDDAIFQSGSSARVMLGYAQSWLLVHYLMKDQDTLPRFRNYLQAIAKRTRPDHRLEDAQAHLGDLDHLDRDLRRYAVRIQLSLR